jgi:hypothetical protein
VGLSAQLVSEPVAVVALAYVTNAMRRDTLPMVSASGTRMSRK